MATSYPLDISRVASTVSTTSSGRYSRVLSATSAGFSDVGSPISDAAKSRHDDLLRDLARQADLPLTLPRPMISQAGQQAVAQHQSDKARAEEYLMSLRPKKFLGGKSSKSFASDEIMLALDRAVNIELSAPIVEALLRIAESSGIDATKANAAFSASKKGQAIPTLDYIFGQADNDKLQEVWQLFLARVSQRARDNSLAGALQQQPVNLSKVRALLEHGANPDLCHGRILELITSSAPGIDDLVEALLLSPSLSNPDFLNQALVQAVSCQSLRQSSMLLLRGADINYNHGEALKVAVTAESYNLTLLGLLLPKKSASATILDGLTSLIGRFTRDIQKSFLIILLYAGCCGPRTSRAVVPYLTARDTEMMGILINSYAFTHGSFPAADMFHAAVDMADTALALSILRSSRARSFTSFMGTGVHMQLVQSYRSNPEEVLNIISELLIMGVSGDFTSQMLAKACEPGFIRSPGILDLLSLLIQNGGAKASHEDGRCLLTAIEAENVAVVRTLMSAQPTRKVLNSSLEHADSVLNDYNPVKLQVWSILIEAGAAGPSIDDQLVKAVDDTPQALPKVKILLPAASLDHSDGEAIIKAIRLKRLDIIEWCLQIKQPRAAVPWIWKQTRQIFAIASSVPYSLPYMQKVLGLLHGMSNGATPLDDLLHEASQCSIPETSFELSRQLLRWGASPDHALGAALVACVKRSDVKTFAALLSANLNKTSLKYAFNESLLLSSDDRYQVVRLLVGAGVEKASLDAALPQILKEEKYDIHLTHLLVDNGAKLHRSVGEHLISPAIALDVQLVESLIPRAGNDSHLLLPLQAVLDAQWDWQGPDGASLPMVKLLMAHMDPGTWADAMFISQVNSLNQHGAELFIGHLTTTQVHSHALHDLLSHDLTNLSRDRLSMTNYLLQLGASDDAVDEVFIEAAQKLNHDWVYALNPHLSSSQTRQSAFEILQKDMTGGSGLDSNRSELTRFLLQQGVGGSSVDVAFLNSVVAMNTQDISRYTPFVSSKNVFSDALDHLTRTADFTLTDKGYNTMRILLKGGASGVALLTAARAAAKFGNLKCVQLLLGTSDQSTVSKAVFQGVLDRHDNFSSPESRLVLSSLVSSTLDIEDAKIVVRLAASSHDIALLKSVAMKAASASEELYSTAVATIASSQRQWLSTTGLAFVSFLLEQISDSPEISQLIETSAKFHHLPALKLLLGASTDKPSLANTAFAALDFDQNTLMGPEQLSIVQVLLEAGARGPIVENTVAHVVKISDYDALDIFLQSSAAASIIPSAFRAATRDKPSNLTSEQLSIATILVRRGVSTELLAIAATEAAKLLDLEALKVLSESPRFSGATDDVFRTLMLSEENWWQTFKGTRIMQHLLAVGVSINSTKAAASKAAAALNFDALSVIIESRHGSKVSKTAFTSMTGLGRKWLCSEGLRIAELLLRSKLPQPSLDTAFIQASQSLNNEAFNLLYPFIRDTSVFSTALAEATVDENEWLGEIALIQKLLDTGLKGDLVESILIKGARALHLGLLQTLAPQITRPEVYTKAITAAQTNQNWRQSLEVIDLLLQHGAHGEPVEHAYATAASQMDEKAIMLLSNYVNNSNAHDRAFSAATKSESWLMPHQFRLLTFLHDRGISASAIEPALIVAARALNVPMVELLSTSSTEKLAAAAFGAITVDEIDWKSPAGTSILSILVKHGARGPAVNHALIQGTRHVRLDLVNMLCPLLNPTDSQYCSAAFDALIMDNDNWFADSDALRIIQVLVEKGAAPASASKALIEAARFGSLTAVMTLSKLCKDAAVYAEAFNTLTQLSSIWLQRETLELLEYLLLRANIDENIHAFLTTVVEQVILDRAPFELLALLLQSGANVNFNDGKALQVAVQQGQLDVVQLLCQSGPDPLTLYMAMQAALCNNHEEQTVLHLFDLLAGPDSPNEKPDVNHDSELGQPLIFFCLQCYPSSVELTRMVCDLGADLAATISWLVYENEPNLEPPAADPIPPLLFALCMGVSDEVLTQVLLSYNADVEYIAPNSRANALILAARRDRQDMVSTFLDLGSRVAHKDCFDRTPLFYASRTGNTTTINSILKKRPLPNDGSLHEAARELHADAVKMLVAAGHDVNFPSLKHGGRNPLCELCFDCHGSDDLSGLHSTLSELAVAKVVPLNKCRGRSALFFAIENPDPVPVVSKLIEVILWRDHSDPANVFEDGNLFYSATMYIKKGICLQPEKIGLAVLDVLQDVNVEDRYYAKERMQQPKDAVGMPQRIADLDHKKWIRSTRLEEERDDHQRKLRHEEEEMTNRDRLSTQRHLLTMEHREDVAQQIVSHTADTNWQTLQFRSREHEQAMRIKDQQLSSRLDEQIAMQRLKAGLDQQSRMANIEYDDQVQQQKLNYIGHEQGLRLGGAHAQQQLRLGGISAESALKRQQETDELAFRTQRGQLEQSEMDYKLQHLTDVNADKVSTLTRLESVARESQLRKNELDQSQRMAQLEHQQSSDDVRLRTEDRMNQYRRDNDEGIIRRQSTLGHIERNTMRDKHDMIEMDRQKQLGFQQNADQQRMSTLQTQGRIQNRALFDRGRIENNTLSERNDIVHDGRMDEIAYTAAMGEQRTENEYSVGQARLDNRIRMNTEEAEHESDMGQRRLRNEQGLGQMKQANLVQYGNLQLQNSQNLGIQNVQNSRNLGMQNLQNTQRMGVQNARNKAMMGQATAYSNRLAGNEQLRTAQGLARVQAAQGAMAINQNRIRQADNYNGALAQNYARHQG